MHWEGCKGAPVLIPCPLPRSVTFTVRLGECTCDEVERSLLASGHAPRCPSNPIRVSCSIGGKTWKESEVMDVEMPGWHEARTPGEFETERLALVACRERWALVKALVLGQPLSGDDTTEHLFAQRDAVFAALADMARAENAAVAAQRALAGHHLQARQPVHQVRPENRPSADYLAAYVEHLVEQVGALQ